MDDPRLVRPHEALLQAADLASAAEWDPRLPPERFAARERALRRGPWPRAAQRPWAWMAGGTVLASCEIYEVDHPAGRVWLVASVYTPPPLRGRGHASALLRAVEGWARAQPGALALTLFSDVGAALYERLGYRALPAWDLVWDPVPADPDDGPWQRFGESELAAWVACAWPPLLQLDWQIDRSRTRAEVAPAARPSRCGAALDGHWIVWTDEDEELLILAADAASPGLVEAARRTAAAAGLRAVRAWEAPPFLPGGRREPRDGQLPMVLLLRAGATPSDLGPWPRGAWV